MKPEQLLESIGGVGEDLLAASENPIRVEKHRPRAWVALAAVLALAVGIGGFAAWKLMNRKPSQKTPTVSAELPTLISGESEGDGPVIPVEDWEDCLLYSFAVDWQELSGTTDSIKYCTESELESYLLFASPGLKAAEAGKLPVYRDKSLENGASGLHVYYSQAELTQLLQQTAEAMGLTVLSEKPQFFSVADIYRNTAVVIEYGPDEPVYTASVDTDQGSLTIRGDGQIGLMYDADHVYSAPNAGQQDSFSSADHSAISGFIEERLSFLPEGVVMAGLGAVLQYPLSSNFGYLWIYPQRSDPVQNLLSQQLDRICLLTVDGSRIYGFTMQTPFFLKSWHFNAQCTVPECWSLMGNYDVISPEEAAERVRQGQFLLPNPVKDLEINQDLTSCAEIVYLTDQRRTVQLPFYRFWIRSTVGEDGNNTYLAVYVPAVTADYLSDYPGGSSMEASREGEAAFIAQAVSSELSILGLKDEFYDLLTNGMDRLYETWSGDDAQSHPRFGFEQTASTADGEWYWRDPSGSCTPEEAARELVTMLMKSLARESSVKDMGYELLDYHVYLHALCSSADLSVLPENVWIFDPDVTVKYTGRYGLNGTPEWAGEHGLLASDGYYSELQQGSDYCFLYVLTYREGVWRLQRLEELVNTYLPVEHYSGQPVKDENDETLRALRIFFQDREHQALLLGEDDRLDMEIDSYLRISDDELQLRYWRGGDKMIPYVANLRPLEDGGWEVLSNDPAVWNEDD